MENSGNITFSIRDQIGIMEFTMPPDDLVAASRSDVLKGLQEFIMSHRPKGLIITGTWGRFPAGKDTRNTRSAAGDHYSVEEGVSREWQLPDFIRELEIPVIAAIEGECTDGGMEIALACHIRICSENTLFSFSGSDPGGTQRLTKFLNNSWPYEKLRDSGILNAVKAREMEIADQVIPDGLALDHSLQLLNKLVHNRSLEVIMAVMRSVHMARSRNPEEAMIGQTRLFCTLATAEARRRKKEQQELQ